MLLTERQKFMLRDLLNQENNITAKTLAGKYNVSLRTVRYDLESIEYWLKEIGATLIKVPRVGMRVQNKEESLKAIKTMNFNANEVLLSQKDRRNIIILRLVFSSKPVTSEELAEELYVSRSTIISTIKEINRELQEYSICIEGKTHYGFMLTGQEKNIRCYIRTNFAPLIVNSYKEKLYSLSGKLSISKESEMAGEVISLLKNQPDIRFHESAAPLLKFRIITLIRRIFNGNRINLESEEISRYKTTKIYSQTKNIYQHLVDKYGLPYEEGEIAYFSHIILSENIDIHPINEERFNEEKLRNVVGEIVNIGLNYLNIRDSELETLSKELFSHLKTTLSRYELNVISENPILEQIKAKYGDVFEVARKACNIFKGEYGFELSEDEIGFLTMYFLKSLEKSKINVKKNIVVVCNTSRGTSKLLATRIKNNIPEVNIKDIVSIIDIEKDKELLEDVDLIISTIKLDTAPRPTITVSPIITTYELTKIRDFLYLDYEYTGEEKSTEKYMEDTLTTIIEKYTHKKNIGKLHREIMSLIGFYSNNLKEKTTGGSSSGYTELIGLILVEISDMIMKLYPHGMDQEEFKKACGIIIHTIMAIPRWQNGEYNPEKNLKLYEKKYGDKFCIIEETFHRITEKYKIPIKRTEIVAILRYLI